MGAPVAQVRAQVVEVVRHPFRALAACVGPERRRAWNTGLAWTFVVGGAMAFTGSVSGWVLRGASPWDAVPGAAVVLVGLSELPRFAGTRSRTVLRVVFGVACLVYSALTLFG